MDCLKVVMEERLMIERIRTMTRNLLGGTILIQLMLMRMVKARMDTTLERISMMRMKGVILTMLRVRKEIMLRLGMWA